MVMADEEDSRAQRLFPSSREVDGDLYGPVPVTTGRNGLIRPGRITPFDIEYSDKRGAMTNVALFYKRFPDHPLGRFRERKGVFGHSSRTGHEHGSRRPPHTRHFRLHP